MRVVVCGGRDFADKGFIEKELNRLHRIGNFKALAQGGAVGADYIAMSWAISQNIPVFTFEAEWDTFGLSAGPIRNTKMLDDFEPDMVIAFPGRRGTADLLKKAQLRRIETIDYGALANVFRKPVNSI